MSTNPAAHRPRQPGKRLARWGWCLALAFCAAASSPAGAEDTPRDIILILDVSRSMDEAFPRVMDGVEAFLADTRPDETLTLSTFGDGVRTVTRGLTLGPAAQPAIHEMLAQLAPTDRFTNITYAVDRALSELIRLGPAPGRLREVILVTDGKHNPPPGGRTPEPSFEDLRRKARRLDDRAWYVRYIVLGGEYDPDMTAFARDTGGEAVMLKHIRDPRLGTDLADTLRAAWLQADVTLESAIGGVLLERAGQEAAVPGADATVREGDRVLLGPDGYAILRTAGGARFGLNPDTQWVLEQARWHPASGRIRMRGGVIRGVALATGADVPLVDIGLAGAYGAIHTRQGTVALQATDASTAVAAPEAGARTLAYAATDPTRLVAALTRPDIRPAGAGPQGAPRDAPPGSAEELLSGGRLRAASGVGAWSTAQAYDRTWVGWFEGWRPTLETGAPLTEVPNAILLARQPPRLMDIVITATGQFEGDVLTDDDEMIILQMEAGLKFFRAADVQGVKYAAFPLSSAKVESVIGQAEFRRVGRGDAWRELIVGTKLRPGDMVKTGDDTRVVCTVAGQVVVAIKENSEVTIEDVRRDNATGDVRVRLKLDAGQLWNDVGRLASARSRYVVETPQASAGVRGTIFTVLYDKTREESTVAAVTGAVQVVQKTEALRELVVKAQEQTTVDVVALKQARVTVTQIIDTRHVTEWRAQEEEFEQQREVMEVEYPPPNPEPVRAALRALPPAPTREGRTVTWFASYEYDTDDGRYEYEFAVRGPATDGRWRVVRDFAPDKTWTWDTTDYAGKNFVRVRVQEVGVEIITEANAFRSYAVRESRTSTVLLALGGVWMLVLTVVLGVQFGFEPKGAQHARLRIISAPQGLPRTELKLPPMTGMRIVHEARMGCAQDCELPLGDETLARTQCRVQRLRFGPWLRTTLTIEPGAPVYVDGILLGPSQHRLSHMMRLRMGEYEIRYETDAPPLPIEVVCRDGHIVRGSVGRADLLTAQTLVVRAALPGVPSATVQFSTVEYIRCYRTRAEDARMRRRPGSGAVGGPVVRVWFTATRLLTGRLEAEQDAAEGRFKMYTDEAGGLGFLLVNAAAAQRIKVFPGTERPPTYTPMQEQSGGQSRLALAGPGPTAIGSRALDAAVERAHRDAEAREPDETDTPDTPAAPEKDTEGRDDSPKPPKTPPSPQEKERYIRRRGKPRI